MMERLNVDPGAAAREGHGEGFAAAGACAVPILPNAGIGSTG
jgi:hypothetical protein